MHLTEIRIQMENLVEKEKCSMEKGNREFVLETM